MSIPSQIKSRYDGYLGEVNTTSRTAIRVYLMQHGFTYQGLEYESSPSSAQTHYAQLEIWEAPDGYLVVFRGQAYSSRAEPLEVMGSLRPRGKPQGGRLL